MKYYNEEEVKKLLSAVEGTRYAALYHLVVTTGMRLGKLFALKWFDVDWASSN